MGRRIPGLTEKRDSSEALIDSAHDVVRASIAAVARVTREALDASTDAARKVQRSLKHTAAATTPNGDNDRVGSPTGQRSRRSAS